MTDKKKDIRAYLTPGWGIVLLVSLIVLWIIYAETGGGVESGEPLPPGARQEIAQPIGRSCEEYGKRYSILAHNDFETLRLGPNESWVVRTSPTDTSGVIARSYFERWGFPTGTPPVYLVIPGRRRPIQDRPGVPLGIGRTNFRLVGGGCYLLTTNGSVARFWRNRL